MLGPPSREPARSRALAAAAALLTLAGASAVLGVGSSTATGVPAPAAARAPFVGPVAPAVVPRPLVRTDGPLLVPVGAIRVGADQTGGRLTAVLGAMGPRAATAPVEPGPPMSVGPGSAVPAVRAVQRLLNAAGAALRVDGAWGPATTRAVEAAQAEAGLRVTGWVDPGTRAVLRSR